ncbi:hypothetical protein [Streptomyces sp. NPDC007929]|uniref:hypothetical protein n=1 Tax=unclassified Streptomyces TaxID=2593676 RepID=UPI0036E22662
MKAVTEYRNAHAAVVDLHGRAAVNVCVWCGGFADQWCYDWSCPQERQADGLTWSDDPARYQAMCAQHHSQFDGAFHRVGFAGLAAEIAPLREAASARYDAKQRAHIDRVATRQAILEEQVLREAAEERIARAEAKCEELRATIEVKRQRIDLYAFRTHDPLSSFFPGLFVQGDETDRIMGSVLYEIYEDWCSQICDRLGIPKVMPVRRISFYRALEERGAVRKKRQDGIWLYGIKLG